MLIGHAKVWLLIVASLVLAGAVYLVNNGDDSMRPRATRVEVNMVDTSNPKDLEDWARQFCRGWTVAKLATELKVEATMGAVVKDLSKGLEGEARQAISKACESELRMNEQSK